MENQTNNDATLKYSIDSAKENRRKALEVLREFSMKFVNGTFTVAEMMKYYNYNEESAFAIVDVLGKNGLCAMLQKANQAPIYQLITDPQKQLINIEFYLNNAQNQVLLYSTTMQIILDELTQANALSKA